MKNRIILYSIASLLLLCACNKDRNEKSTIRIGDKELTTRKVQGFFIMGVPEIHLSEKLDGKEFAFGFDFNVNYFPKQGSFTLSKGGSNANQVPVGLTLDGVQYFTDEHNSSYIDAYEHDAKAKYIINPTWFYSHYPDPTNTYYIRGNDSVLVSGTLYEPKDITVR